MIWEGNKSMHANGRLDSSRLPSFIQFRDGRITVGEDEEGKEKKTERRATLHPSSSDWSPTLTIHRLRMYSDLDSHRADYIRKRALMAGLLLYNWRINRQNLWRLVKSVRTSPASSSGLLLRLCEVCHLQVWPPCRIMQIEILKLKKSDGLVKRVDGLRTLWIWSHWTLITLIWSRNMERNHYIDEQLTAE